MIQLFTMTVERNMLGIERVVWHAEKNWDHSPTYEMLARSK